MSKLFPATLAILLLAITPAFANNNWVATPLGSGPGGTVQVNVALVSDFEQPGCVYTPCRTMWFVDLYVSPAVSGTTHYTFSSPQSAQAGVDLLLVPNVEYSFSGSYFWANFLQDHMGACAAADCYGSVPTETLLFTPTIPVATRNSTWGAIKALYR